MHIGLFFTMSQSPLVFEFAVWWLVPAFLVAVGASVLLYVTDKFPWSNAMARWMGTLRFLVIFAMGILLLNPLAHLFQNQTEQPIVALAIDNSSSVWASHDSLLLHPVIGQVTEMIRQSGYKPTLFSLSGIEETTQITFNSPRTDLNGLLSSVREAHEGQNLGAIVLLSDGIFNTGFNPSYASSIVPVYTIGTGDTIPPVDVGIVSVKANQVVYEGNQFPIEILVQNEGFEQQPARVQVFQGTKEIDSREIVLTKNQSVNFLIEASGAGLKRFTVQVSKKEGEKTYANNQFAFYVDVVEGKERVLIVSDAPHPDIRVLRSVLAKTDNYETSLYIKGISEFDEEADYDVVIWHGAFHPRLKLPEIKGDPSFWYFIDEASDLRQTLPLGLSIETMGNQRDNVRPFLNPGFSHFNLSGEFTGAFSDYPTIEVPFGNYEINGPAQVLLFQQVGSIATNKPLMYFFDNGNQRAAVCMGTGLWKWHIQEGAIRDQTENFDQFVLKSIQYLSVRTDKRKFRFDPEQQSYLEGEKIFFRSESYNDVYERIGGNPIHLRITNEENKSLAYDFTGMTTHSSLPINPLPAGVYTYEAITTLGSAKHTQRGEFMVKKIQMEALSVQADHRLLRNIARNTGGTFHPIHSTESLGDELKMLSLKSIIHTSQEFIPLINLISILFLIILLLSVEWFLRKYLGGY